MPAALELARPRPVAPPVASREAHEAARVAVKELLQRSKSFNALSEDQRRELAHGLVRIGSYLAEPEGVRLAPDQQSPAVRALAGDATTDAQTPQFGQATRTGIEQMAALVKQVDFPNFVSGLIQGVFHAIVDSSIKQMQAYTDLVANVSKSLDQFRDDNTTQNQGRDHLISQFPDLFQLNIGGDDPFGGDQGDGSAPAGPTVVLKDGVDETKAVARINQSLPLSKPLTGIDNDTVESQLVPAAQQQLATGRQQLLATLVLMGINRIVVTDGKIQAKVTYDFKARDNRKFLKSATSFDYAKDSSGNLQYTTTQTGTYESKTDGAQQSRSSDGSSDERDASYYAKGDYQNTQSPVVTVQTTTNLMDDSQLSTKATLLGNVEVNFKSDYLPLEKLATPENIAAIQMRSVPAKAPPASTSGGSSAAAPASTSPAPAAH
jgi:hypothetical protein